MATTNVTSQDASAPKVDSRREASPADRVYDQQTELTRIECALQLARAALTTTAKWDSDTTLSAIHMTMWELAERIEAVCDALDGIQLDLAAVEREGAHAAH